jgi:hypothetical protein
MRRLFLSDQVYQGIGEPELGVGVPAAGGQPGAAYQGIVGTVNERHGVQQKDLFIHGCKLTNLGKVENKKGNRAGPRQDIPGRRERKQKPPHRHAAALLLSYENPICKQI